MELNKMESREMMLEELGKISGRYIEDGNDIMEEMRKKYGNLSDKDLVKVMTHEELTRVFEAAARRKGQ